MKRKLVAMMMLCVVLTGCQSGLSSIDDKTDGNVAANEDPTIDVEGSDAGSDNAASEDVAKEDKAGNGSGSYDSLISEIKEAVEKGDISALDVSASTQIKAGEMEMDTDVRYGYLKKDLDGDGTDELILGSTNYIVDTNLQARGRYNSVIYDIFTLKDGNPEHVIKCEGYDRYYFGTDGTIIKEEGNLNSDTTIAVATFNNFNKDKLEVVEGIRYDLSGDDVVYYRSDSDPTGDGAEKITYDKWKEIIDKHGYEFTEFTPFVEPAAPTKKATVYVRTFEEDYLDSAIQYKWREYKKYYDDHTGFDNTGNDPLGEFSSYDEEAIDDLISNGFVEEQ